MCPDPICLLGPPAKNRCYSTDIYCSFLFQTEQSVACLAHSPHIFLLVVSARVPLLLALKTCTLRNNEKNLMDYLLSIPDLDPCSRWPPVCSQTCIRTTGGFRCECISGYHLDKDQHHCRADSTNAPTFLVYNQGASIFKVDLTSNNTWSHPVLLHRAHDTVTAIGNLLLFQSSSNFVHNNTHRTPVIIYVTSVTCILSYRV